MEVATALSESHCSDHTAEQWRRESGEEKKNLNGKEKATYNIKQTIKIANTVTETPETYFYLTGDYYSRHKLAYVCLILFSPHTTK